MKVISENIWDYHLAGYICVTTNGIVKHNGELVMGAGIALQAKLRFPGLPAKLGAGVRAHGNQVLYCADERILSFPTKHHYRDPSDLNLIEASCLQSMSIADHYSLKRIFLPRPGCGNGELSPKQVDPLIHSILDDRFVMIVR